MKNVHRRFRRKSHVKNDRSSRARRGRQSGLRFESLEARLLLAADLGMTDQPEASLGIGLLQPGHLEPRAAIVGGEGEASDQAEGEAGAVQSLGAFARELTNQGVRLFGSDTCFSCIRQKDMFGTDQDKLPYIEVEDLASDPSLNPTGRPITATPTWEFQDLHRVEGILTLQEISEHSGIPLPPDIVRFNTNFIDFEIRLLPGDAPGTVDNFLTYINDGDFDSSFFHRYIPGFVLQGGGFNTPSAEFTSTTQFGVVPTDPTIQNEFSVSNTAGTIAMAKLGSDPNSATSQFFINLGDNSGNLDNQNGGFTVFAELTDAFLIDDLQGSLSERDEGDVFSALPVFGDPNQVVVIESIDGSGTVSGIKFNDADGDGVRDTGEAGLGGFRIYSDENGNGQLDDGELFVTT
ncbi:MAG: peptidylprolyl isomerase, partial [Pirellulaceae bacterium]